MWPLRRLGPFTGARWRRNNQQLRRTRDSRHSARRGAICICDQAKHGKLAACRAPPSIATWRLTQRRHATRDALHRRLPHSSLLLLLERTRNNGRRATRQSRTAARRACSDGAEWQSQRANEQRPVAEPRSWQRDATRGDSCALKRLANLPSGAWTLAEAFHHLSRTLSLLWSRCAHRPSFTLTLRLIR